tara:strand:+ start:3646 stop:4392 length:747 start_codon:yes stop_codon:yes gene_type:complete
MAKTFTDKPLRQFDQVKTANITTNLDKNLDELNGRLDSNNLPVKSVLKIHLKEASGVETVGGSVDRLESVMPTQAYYQSKRDYNSANTAGATDIYDPILSIDLDNDFYGAGFNPLQELDSNFEDFPLRFDAREGMLIGCANIDWEHGNQVFDIGGDVGGARGRGQDWWTEIQVYVNNVVVAQTGKIMPRRLSTQIPFCVPTGTQPVTIDVRVKINNWYVAGGPGLPGTWIATDFKIFSANIWCRNQYR